MLKRSQTQNANRLTALALAGAVWLAALSAAWTYSANVAAPSKAASSVYAEPASAKPLSASR